MRLLDSFAGVSLVLLTFAPVAACSLINAPDDPKAGAGGGGTTTTTGGAGGTGGAECATAADCASLDGVCRKGACNAGQCVAEDEPDGTECDDGKFCTEDDVCTAGLCAGAPKVCPAPPAVCTISQCNEQADACEDAAAPNGTTCDDSDPCTGDGTCQGGACQMGANACVDDECSTSVCDPGVGCVKTPINEGAQCDVMNPCGYFTCTAGLCMLQGPNDGYPCEDALFCTRNEYCMGGQCIPGAEPACPTDAGCGTWTCDEATLSCIVTPANDAMPCNDGKSCTQGEMCSGGFCGGGATPSVYFSEDFDDNSAGWFLDPEWQIGPAVTNAAPPNGPSSADPEVDHSPSLDNGMAGVVIGGNADTGLHGFYFLTSPPFNTQFAGQVVLGFYRWINSDYPPYMHNKIEVYDADTATWNVVWFVPDMNPEPLIDSPPAGTGWTYVQYDLTPYKSSATQIRFGFDVSSGGVYTIGSWNIDDIIVGNAGCP